MAEKHSHQWITGVSFGLTSGTITALGMLVGLYAATSSTLAVVAGLVTMAIADGLADAAGLHIVEEAQMEKGRTRYNSKEIWLTTLVTFLSVTGIILTFVIPILFFPIDTAVLIAIGWGLLLLVLLNLFIAKIKKEEPVKLIIEHIVLAAFVIIVSNWVGGLIGAWLR